MSEARVEGMDRMAAGGVAPSGRRGAVRAGAPAGLFGGAVMIAWLVAAGAVLEVPAGHALAAIATTLSGPAALAGGAGAVATGLVLVLLLSSALGVLFAAVVPGDYPAASAAGVGVGYALLAMALAAWIVPAVNPHFAEAIQPMGGAWVIANALFGAALGLAIALRPAARER